MRDRGKGREGWSALILGALRPLRRLCPCLPPTTVSKPDPLHYIWARFRLGERYKHIPIPGVYRIKLTAVLLQPLYTTTCSQPKAND